MHRIFEDDKTGYIAHIRKEFNGLLNYLEDNGDKVDGIVCFEISRLARNFGDGGQILWLMQKGVIKRIYTASKMFTNSSSDQLMVAIEFAMSKKSSDEGSERTKSGMKSKATNLKHPARRPVLGYKGEGPRGARKWIIDPKIAEQVRQVFETYASRKFTLQEICDYAYDIGLRSTDSRSKTGKISKNTWQGRLKDIQYTGIFYHNEERIAGEYEPIISNELHYQVQEVMEGRANPKSTHIDYAYSGLIKCGSCKGNLSGTHKKGITYYRCRKDKAPCKGKKLKYHREDEVEKFLLPAFESIEIDQKTWKASRDYVNELNQPEKIKTQRYIKELNAKVEVEENFQLSLGRKFTSGEFTKSDYHKLKTDSEAKIASCKNSIVKSENILHELNELMDKFLDDVRYVTRRLRVASALNKREMVEIFCENLIWKNGKLRIYWKKPYFMLANQAKSSTMLRRRYSY
ncbi:recombinase family protein [Patescibacteria group bacterium]|nr:recombinase family protein [Patescibacteria group bacterium]